MDIVTNDAELVTTRKTVIELILSTHPTPASPARATRSASSSALAAEFGVREQPFPKRLQKIPIDDSTGSLILNPEKCIRCGRCVKVCQDMQNVWALSSSSTAARTPAWPLPATSRWPKSPASSAASAPPTAPTGAIVENDETAARLGGAATIRTRSASCRSPRRCA